MAAAPHAAWQASLSSYLLTSFSPPPHQLPPLPLLSHHSIPFPPSLALFHASFDASYSYLGVVGSEHTMLEAAAATTALAAVALAVRTRGRLFLTYADREVE